MPRGGGKMKNVYYIGKKQEIKEIAKKLESIGLEDSVKRGYKDCIGICTSINCRTYTYLHPDMVKGGGWDWTKDRKEMRDIEGFVGMVEKQMPKK